VSFQSPDDLAALVPLSRVVNASLEGRQRDIGVGFCVIVIGGLASTTANLTRLPPAPETSELALVALVESGAEGDDGRQAHQHRRAARDA
jgi:hypothetical protein